MKKINKTVLIAVSLFIFTLLINFAFTQKYIPDAQAILKRNLVQSIPFEKGAYFVCDDLHYEYMAGGIISGHGFSLPDRSRVWQPTMYREPLYPFFLAFIYMLFGHNVAFVIAAQKILLALAVVLVYLIGINILGSPRRDIISATAAIFTALDLNLHYYSNLVYAEVTATFLTVLFVFIFINALKRRSGSLLAISAVILGATALCRVITAFYFLVAGLLIILFFRDLRRAVRLKFLLVFFTGYFIVVTPWIIRNYMLFKYPAITCRGGTLLWFRTSKLGLGFAELNKRAVFTFSRELGMKFYPGSDADYSRILDMEYAAYEKYYSGLRDKFNEEQIDKIAFKDSMEKIKMHPVKYLAMNAYELLALNSFFLNVIVLEKTKSVLMLNIWRLSYKLCFFLAIGLFFLGLFHLRKNRLSWVLLSLILYVNILNSFFDIQRAGMRYILPVVPFYLFFAAVGLYSLWGSVHEA